MIDNEAELVLNFVLYARQSRIKHLKMFQRSQLRAVCEVSLRSKIITLSYEATSWRCELLTAYVNKYRYCRQARNVRRSGCVKIKPTTRTG